MECYFQDVRLSTTKNTGEVILQILSSLCWTSHYKVTKTDKKHRWSNLTNTVIIMLDITLQGNKNRQNITRLQKQTKNTGEVILQILSSLCWTSHYKVTQTDKKHWWNNLTNTSSLCWTSHYKATKTDKKHRWSNLTNTVIIVLDITLQGYKNRQKTNTMVLVVFYRYWQKHD
jgi:hypothetical protein